jgi:hypothetical protein
MFAVHQFCKSLATAPVFDDDEIGNEFFLLLARTSER